MDLQKYRIRLPSRTPQRRSLPSAANDQGSRPQLTMDQIREKYSSPRHHQQRSMLLVDATGSMAPYWDHIHETINEIIDRLTAMGGKPFLKVVAYRDDCDEPQVIEESPWCNDAAQLKRFVGMIGCGGGGDRPEAVDIALLSVLAQQEKVTSAILIGDAPPHSNREGLVEAKQLGEQQCPVYSIPVGGEADTRAAFSEISRISGGKLLELGNFKELFEILGVVLAHDLGETRFRAYIKRYQHHLGPSASAAARLLIEHDHSKR